LRFQTLNLVALYELMTTDQHSSSQIKFRHGNFANTDRMSTYSSTTVTVPHDFGLTCEAPGAGEIRAANRLARDETDKDMDEFIVH